MPEISAAEANRRFYAELAETYDTTEECVADPRHRDRLRRMLDRALAQLPAEPRVLDACGGSGNASLLLAERGIVPVTVDVSPEMLALYTRKARALGVEPDVRIAEIQDFLCDDASAWDLVVFSSALHHLEDAGEVLELAAARLAPRGLLATIYDPTRLGRAGPIARRFDYGLHVALKTPRRLPGLVRRRAAGSESVGELAERHALTGLDDLALAERLRAAGLEILAHDREYEARYGITRLTLRGLGSPSSFALLAVRH